MLSFEVQPNLLVLIQRPELVGEEKWQNRQGEEVMKKRWQTEEEERVGEAVEANTKCYYCVITVRETCRLHWVDLI